MLFGGSQPSVAVTEAAKKFLAISSIIIIALQNIVKACDISLQLWATRSTVLGT